MTSKNKHHYIPASYLSGFASNGKRTSQFIAVRKDGTNFYGTNPDDSGAERNYYKLESLTEDPLKVENWYGENLEKNFG